eukprot:352888-Chlamydomonas_euryale.AAC.4
MVVGDGWWMVGSVEGIVAPGGQIGRLWTYQIGRLWTYQIGRLWTYQSGWVDEGMRTEGQGQSKAAPRLRLESCAWSCLGHFLGCARVS